MTRLTSAQETELRLLMGRSCETSVVAQIMDKDHRYTSPRLTVVGAQVTIEWSADVDRACELKVLDPMFKAGLGEKDPQMGSVYLDRMLRVWWGVRASWGWHMWPVFTGPLAAPSRVGAELVLQAYGKEVYMRPPYSTWGVRSVPARTNLATLVRTVASWFGEARFSLIETSVRTKTAFIVTDESDTWKDLRTLCRRAGFRLFYDGRGVLTLDRVSSRSRFVFRGGDGGTVLSQPEMAPDYDDANNTVHVLGSTPEGAKNPLSAWARLPDRHALSPEALKRNGVRAYRVQRIDDSTLDAQTEVTLKAKAMVTWLGRVSTNIRVETLPVPWLNPGDRVTVATDDWAAQTRLTTATWSLTGGRSVIGYTQAPTTRRWRNR